MSENQKIIEALLHQQTPVVFRAGGPSMNPTIRDGDLVRIRPLKSNEFFSYIVILYQIRGRLSLHRLILNQKRTNRCFVAGDAATTGGDWISTSDILGIAEWGQRGNQTHRLDTRSSRMAGQIRYRLRPLRRILLRFHSATHAQTPAKHS